MRNWHRRTYRITISAIAVTDLALAFLRLAPLSRSRYESNHRITTSTWSTIATEAIAAAVAATARRGALDWTAALIATSKCRSKKGPRFDAIPCNNERPRTGKPCLKCYIIEPVSCRHNKSFQNPPGLPAMKYLELSKSSTTGSSMMAACGPVGRRHTCR